MENLFHADTVGLVKIYNLCNWPEEHFKLLCLSALSFKESLKATNMAKNNLDINNIEKGTNGENGNHQFQKRNTMELSQSLLYGGVNVLKAILFAFRFITSSATDNDDELKDGYRDGWQGYGNYIQNVRTDERHD